MPDSPFRPGSDAEWEDLLRRLRRQSAAQPSPFLYAQVRARLAAQAAAPLVRVPGWLRRSAYALAFSGLVLVVSGDGAATPHPGLRGPELRQAQ